MVPPCHQLQRNQKKQYDHYSQKSFDNLKLIIVNLSPKLTDLEKRSIATCFWSSSQDQYIETYTKIILTHVLNRWNENKSIAQASAYALNPAETVALKIYIQLNLNSIPDHLFNIPNRRHNMTQIRCT